MATKFALVELRILMPDGKMIPLWLDGNSKITLDNGTFDQPAANALSLVHKRDCPLATPICKSVCYVNKLEQREAEVYEKYVINSRNIRLILANPGYFLVALWAVSDYIKKSCRGGFRWQVSGDIFSMAYARFIREVCRMSPEVPHWLYTRSLAYLDPLLDVENLVVNLSADEDNWPEVRSFARTHNLRPCYLAIRDDSVPDDLPDDSVIFPSYSLRNRSLDNDSDAGWIWFNFVLTARGRRMICPADFFGQSERFRCGVCRKCLKPFRSS